VGRAREGALPRRSDVNLLCDSKGIVDLDAKVSNSAFDLSVTEEQLYRS